MEKINFLVGENSTGKTSILKLIDLISSGDFWFNGNFRTDNVDFSYYGDVSSSTGNSNGSTRIGILYENEDSEGIVTDYSAILMTIAGGANKKTILKSIRCAYEGKELNVRVQKRITYKVLAKTSFTPELFDQWCSEEADTTGYRALEKDVNLYMDRSPYFIINVLSGDRNSNSDKEGSFSHPPFAKTVAPHTWIAPIRIKPQLTYDGNIYDYSSDGAHAPYLLKTIMSKSENARTKKIVAVLEKFGKESGLFDSVNVKQFARQGNSPFSIEVITGGVRREITNVGYGVSQVLPIIIEVLNHNGYRFAIQQPEVHLHPRAQASLGTFFYSMINDYSARFTIETHSDFIIDRFRQQVANNKSRKVSSQVLFFEHKNGKNIVHSIKIKDDGSYSDDQPDNFRKFFFNEELKNMAI